jgi:hypothetical protein
MKGLDMRSIGQRLFGSAYGTGETGEVLHKAKKMSGAQ